MGGNFYITTPIYYVNDVPHLGHAYTTVAADVLARFKRLMGHEVFFLTGTDEHGQKVERSALERGETPIQLADRVVIRFQEMWKKLNISCDDFIRTTQERHKRAVTLLINKAREKGDIYLGDYEGWYCTPCETYITETDLADGRCPNCGREVERLREKSYFFRLSRYKERLLEHMESNPDFIQPETRRREVMGLVRQGLKDLSISRTSFSWGIPVPWDESHVIYVWFDALTNYLTGAGFAQDGDSFQKFWPADVHIIGKDILRFHSIYWPAFLMSAGLPMPRKIFAHGWWTVEGQKMSKSLGNVVDPGYLADRYGVDQLRYFLLREVPFGLDGDFSHQAIVNRINSELANDLGNLVSRVLTMLDRYFRGATPPPKSTEERDRALIDQWNNSLREVEGFMEGLGFDRALTSIWQFVRACNKYLDDEAPWALAKRPQGRDRLSTVLYNALESLRLLAVLIYPFMPASAGRVWEQLGLEGDPSQICLKRLSWGELRPDTRIRRGPAIFPRVEE